MENTQIDTGHASGHFGRVKTEDVVQEDRVEIDQVNKGGVLQVEPYLPVYEVDKEGGVAYPPTDFPECYNEEMEKPMSRLECNKVLSAYEIHRHLERYYNQPMQAESKDELASQIVVKQEDLQGELGSMFNFPPTPEQSPIDGSIPQCQINLKLAKSNIKDETQTSLSSMLSTSLTASSIHLQSLVTEALTSSDAAVHGITTTIMQPALEMTSSKTRPAVKTLKFPPCLVCSGKASGLHYGINSCEACKGFFRRYLLRNEEYKCAKGGQCEIINRNRGNCAGCRLKKCLKLGMSKEKSQLGRYTLARRTQTIKEVNKLEGKEDSVIDGCVRYDDVPLNSTDTVPVKDEQLYSPYREFDPSKEIIGRNLHCHEEIDLRSVPSTDTLIETLVAAMDEIKPFGLSISTDQHLQDALKYHFDRYNLKIQMYGQMKSVPKDEFKRLYKDFGIDVDGRMNVLRESAKEVESMIERYCMFAKLIPDFRKLSCRDQSNLLKASRCDFFVILMSGGYSEEYQVFISHNGRAYHIEEAADKFFSKKLITTVCNMYRRWQLLNLSKSEKALLIALTLVFTDRCNLDNQVQVEKIQMSLADLLWKELEKTCKLSAAKRFSKIISYLTLMRESSELYLKEYKELCKDDIVVEEVPMLTEFLLEDW